MATKKSASPEVNPEARRLILKLKRPVNEGTFFGNSVAQLMKSDPAAALTVLDAAEAAQLSRTRIFALRARTHALLGDVEQTHASFTRYLDACRAVRGFYNPPFGDLIAFFTKKKQKALAGEVAEVEAMLGTHFLERLLNADDDELVELADTLKDRATTESGEKRARLCVLEACALARLGKKAPATRAWTAAKAANAEVAAFWKGHPLLA